MLGNKYLAAVVGVILLLVIAYNVKFFSSGMNTPEAGTVQGHGLPAEASVRDTSEIPEKISVKKDTEKWRSDPFALDKISDKTEYNLIGIIKRDGRSLALINGGIYGVNDKAGNGIINEIKKASVILSVNGLNKEIFLEDYIILEEKTE